MERQLYYVCPVVDQLDWDEDGPVDRGLFVWARNASEAVKLWREYYCLEDDEDYVLGVTEKVRVFEAPMMPNTSKSTAIPWDDIYSYGATTTERVEL